MNLDRSIFVELKLTTTPAAGVFLNFLDVPQLQNAYVSAIAAFTDSHISKTPTQNTVFSNTAVKDMLMIFAEGNTNKFEFVPYYDLIPANNGGLYRWLKPFKININKSGVQIGGATATVNHALAFTVYYTY